MPRSVIIAFTLPPPFPWMFRPSSGFIWKYCLPLVLLLCLFSLWVPCLNLSLCKTFISHSSTGKLVSVKSGSFKDTLPMANQCRSWRFSSTFTRLQRLCSGEQWEPWAFSLERGGGSTVLSLLEPSREARGAWIGLQLTLIWRMRFGAGQPFCGASERAEEGINETGCWSSWHRFIWSLTTMDRK